jgi:hypothetical protein
VAHSDVIKEYEAANKLDEFLGISKVNLLNLEIIQSKWIRFIFLFFKKAIYFS